MLYRFILAGFFLLLFASAGAQQVDAPDHPVIEGRLDIVWGDPPPGSNLPSHTVLTVTRDDGSRTEITISEALARAHGGFLSWNGNRVRVHLAGDGSRRARAVTLIGMQGDDTLQGGVAGSEPWVSLLCKFADIGDEPRDLAFFNGMYANEFGGLDDYWRKQSYGKVDIVGSTAVDWVELPRDQRDYIPVPGEGSNSNRSLLFEDCTAAADPFIDFSLGGSEGFSGINMMFNGLLDCCAWGGGRFASLDGLSKSWRTTWNPPWAFQQSAVIAHEMGHGFGLPHSNNFDEDDSPYDSPWDVMSSATGYSVSDNTYGALGKHHTAYHKRRLGWIAERDVLLVENGESVTATIDAMALAATTNYRMAQIPIPGTSSWYTVEARDRSGYDGSIVDKTVIISHIDEGRSEPAWSIDMDNPPADYADNEGTMFRPGEAFFDRESGILISVDSETDNGFVVTINRTGSFPLFDDRFDSEGSPPRLLAR